MKDTKDTKASSDFISHEAQTSDVPPQEFEVDQNIQNEENTLKFRIIARYRKFVKILKLMSAMTTVTSDLLLFLCGLALLVGGCFIQDQTTVLYTMLISHRKKFRALGQTCIVIGVIYVAVMIPAGIFGVIKRKRKLLKIMEYCCCKLGLTGPDVCFDYHTDYVMPTKFNNNDHHLACIALYFQDCSSRNVLYLQLKYWLKRGYYFLIVFMIIQATALFFGWVEARFMPIIYNPEDYVDYEPTSAEIEKARKKNASKNLFVRVLIFFAIKKAAYFGFIAVLTISIAIFKAWAETVIVPFKGIDFTLWELTALCFGWIQSKIIESQEPPSESKLRRNRRRPPKTKLQKVWRQSTAMCYRRMLYCLFAIMFILILIFLKLWYNSFEIKVLNHTFPVTDVLAAVWEEMTKD